MKSPAELFNMAKKRLFNAYSGDAGKMLLHTGTIGWILSATAQIFGIAHNDKISKEKKKFLIPQEIADAGINILTFYTVTNGVQNFTKWLASSGKFITPAIKKFCLEKGIKIVKDEEGNSVNIGKSLLDKVKSFESTLQIGKADHIKITEDEVNHLNSEIKNLNNFYDKTYSPFESGFKIIGNIIGVIISSNIITPLLRNPIAASKQKQSIALEAYENNLKEKSAKPANQFQSKIIIDNYRAKTINNGSMKV